MNTKQTLSLMTTALILGVGISQPVGAEQTWAIRPADDATPVTQSQDAAPPMGSPSPVSSSQVKSAGEIRYVSGGIGESERSELNALSSQFNLHLMFATQGSGEYLSAVQVNILDARKQPVLTVESKGPWFYAQLPPGHYTVEVTPTGHRGEGQTQSKTVNVNGAGPSRFDFYWQK